LSKGAKSKDGASGFPLEHTPEFGSGGGNGRCYKNLDDDGFWFSLAIMPLRGHSKRKASGFAGGYLLNNRPGYFLIYWIP